MRKAVDLNRRLPKNVFSGDWATFLFFDSDWMRDPPFVERLKAFLDRERATCVCLLNLDRAGAAHSDHSFFIDGRTSSDAYLRLLGGYAPWEGWADNFDRMACSSNISEWAMYCEPVNEIAVVAFRTGVVDRYRELTAPFMALPIEGALGPPALSYGFSGLPDEWRNVLLNEYGTR